MPLNRIGKVARARLKVVAELNRRWSDAPWYSTCEIRNVLIEWGFLDYNQMVCLQPLTWAHARKSRHRSDDAPEGSPYSDYAAARGCSFHHMSVLDLLKPSLTEAIVMEAIRRRSALPCEN